MATNQNASLNKKYRDKMATTQQVDTLLKEIKEKTGEVILIKINNRTYIELPAHLSQEEREARVKNYMDLHKS